MMQKVCFTICAFVMVIPGTALGDEPFFMGLGLFNDLENSFATAISPDGSTVVGGGSPDWMSFYAAKWTLEEGWLPLGSLPGGEDYTYPKDVSAGGDVIVGYGRSNSTTPGDCYEGFKWTEADGMVGLGDLPGGELNSRASAVSADGLVIVGRGRYSDGVGSPTTEAASWVGDDPPVSLGGLDDPILSIALGVSADGSVVVGMSKSESHWAGEAFRWTEEEGMVGLGDLSGTYRPSMAVDVAANAEVIVGESFIDSSYDKEPFRWTAETGMIGLGDLPGGSHSGEATGVSADGSVIVGTSHAEVGSTAFIWDQQSGMRSLADVLTDSYGLDLTGWDRLTIATGISHDGLTIVGIGYRGGWEEGWIAHLPEPTTLLLVSVGGLLLTRRRPL